MALRRFSVVACALLLAASSSGCGLGRRISGAPGGPGADGSATPSVPPGVATDYVTTDGFPLRVGYLSPGLAASFRDDRQYRIAPPGRHYVTIEVTFANPTDDRPAPLLVGQPPRLPRLVLAVPRASAAKLGLGCQPLAGFVAAFPVASWCPLEVHLASRKPGASPLNIEVLPPAGSATDYYYSAATFMDSDLQRSRLAEWDLAVQSGPSTFVAVRTAVPGSPSSPGTGASASTSPVS